MKTEWESEVLFQITLCFLHVSYGFSRCKTTKREQRKKKGDRKKYRSAVSIPIAETTRQEITINSKEFQIQGLIPFSS